MSCHPKTLTVLVIAAACAAPALRAQQEASREPARSATTRTPIKHLVILFQENRSFDHYFGTYPRARNLYGENPFRARPHTPAINGFTDGLLNNNPNAAPPMRLGPGDAVE